MIELIRGASFGFRYHRWWQFWKRGFGAAQVVEAQSSASFVHIRVFGSDGSVIAHMPIERSSLQRFIYKELAAAPIPDGLHAISEAGVNEWRREHFTGTAGVFSIPLGDAIDAIMQTLGPAGIGPVVVESAYPVSSGGDFRTVRVIVAGG